MKINLKLILQCIFLIIPFVLYSQDKPGTISVTGVGVASVLPNRVELNIDLSSREEKASDALETNNKRLAKLLNELKSLRVPDTNVSTSNFYLKVQPEYPERDKPPIWVNVASTSLRIKTGDIHAIGKMIDRLVEVGATSITTPIFRFVPEDSLRAIGYKNAVDDAKAKAGKLADSFGVELGKILQASVEMGDIEPRKYYYPPEPEVMALQAGTVIMPYYVTKQVTVKVTFEVVDPEKK